uniref:Uncharacterized protein n=1 Tax=Clastoptera arizonana TaxID=38151 RepID=A0A1B6BY24_9HEMI
MTYKFCFVLILFCFGFAYSKAESYDNSRCKCVCTILNGTQSYNRLIIAPVPPNNNCDGVIPVINNDNKTQELCPRCECSYESRNTTIIKVVVIIVIWIISCLVIYMLFLICLDPLLNKRAKSSYVEHTNEDDESAGPSSHAMGVRSGNVLNRVGHQQDKWKKQVKEQRKNIYDKHTMLN